MVYWQVKLADHSQRLPLNCFQSEVNRWHKVTKNSSLCDGIEVFSLCLHTLRRKYEKRIYTSGLHQQHTIPEILTQNGFTLTQSSQMLFKVILRKISVLFFLQFPTFSTAQAENKNYICILLCTLQTLPETSKILLQR